MSLEKSTRNQLIFSKFKQGSTKAELAKEFKLTEARIYQILDHERWLANHSTPDIPEVDLACKMFDLRPTMASRIQYALRRKKLNTKNRWRKLNRDDILQIYGLGEKAADVILYAQKL